MTSRQRVHAAMHYIPPDRVPVQFYYCPVGYYEHGDKLNTLYSTLEGDFAPFTYVTPPVIPPQDMINGEYHAFRRDAWGTLWEYRIYGVAGIPCEFPLADERKIDSFTTPPVPAPGAFPDDGFYHQYGAGSLFERMIELRPEADVLCDMAMGEDHIHRLADKITEYNTALVENAVSLGADGIAFGDDYGTERAMIMSPALFRSFILPRLRDTFEPARKAGLDIHFHSCGYIWDILPDLAGIGVTSIWPQLPAYDMAALAAYCRSLGLAVAIHTDRARTMTAGTPGEVRDLVLREYETFRMHEGGSWFYIEADNGFPFENIEALVNTVKMLRNG
jgi:uroporphyrinogen decarboxylase